LNDFVKSCLTLVSGLTRYKWVFKSRNGIAILVKISLTYRGDILNRFNLCGCNMNWHFYSLPFGQHLARSLTITCLTELLSNKARDCLRKDILSPYKRIVIKCDEKKWVEYYTKSVLFRYPNRISESNTKLSTPRHLFVI